MPERYIGQSLGKYRVESLIGSGGFAWVFKGFDPELEIPVAIKVLKPQFAGDGTIVDRFRREAATAAKLRHPNIIKIYAVGKEGEKVYFVMDYLPSGLADKLEQTNSLPEDYVLRVGIDVARALDFAHREGVIHRDIKVDNILFDAHGNAVVADFGIARAVSGYVGHTGTNMVVGTPQYFAPEQARAKALDGRADIYSLGVTLFRAVCGRLPFEGDDWYEIARQHVEEPPPAPCSIMPSVSPEFEAVLLQCLAKSPDDRPPRGEVLAEQLEQILSSRRDPSLARTVTIPAHTPSRVTPAVGAGGALAARRGRRAMRIVVPALLGLLVVAAFAAWQVIDKRGPAAVAPDSSGIVPIPKVIPAETSAGRTGPESAATTARTDTLPLKAKMTVTVPADAQLSVNGVVVPTTNGVWANDTLVPKTYQLSAVLPSPLADCKTARVDTTVTLRPTFKRSYTLTPHLCGTLEIRASAQSLKTGRPIDGPFKFALQSGGSVIREGDLPLPGPIVLPAGTYRLIVRVVGAVCNLYDEDGVAIKAGEPTRRSVKPLCP